MQIRFSLLPLVIGTLPLCSCVTVAPPVSADHSRPDDARAREGGDRHPVWRAGFESGRRDSREGYRYDDDRGAQRYEGRERELYRSAYRAGYYSDRDRERNARREGRFGEIPADRRREAYREGFLRGEQDHRAGFRPDWRGHAPPHPGLAEDFSAGYMDGYSRSGGRY